MNIIRVNNIKKTFGGSLLFEHVSFEVNDDDKISIIGRNGVGKTTLFKMILGEMAPDAGDLFIFGKAKIGYLSQAVLSDQDLTLLEEMESVYQDLIELGKTLEDQMKQLSVDASEQMLARYSRLEEAFRHRGGYQYQLDIELMLTKFGFSPQDYPRQVSTFSGGEKTRIAFCKLLLIQPDILLLDEPTNHMDIAIIEWLEDYLRSYPKAVVVITHDKYFINKVTPKIFELDGHTLEKYHGTYEAYELEKQKRYEQRLKAYERQTKEIAHLQSFVDRFRYKAKLASMAQDRVKKIERMEKLHMPKRTSRHLSLEFSTRRPTDAVILRAEHLAIGYDTPLIDNIRFTMRGHDKLAIIGANGSGKTTLLKTMLKEIHPLAGTLELTKPMKLGYFDQTQYLEGLKGSLIDVVHDRYPHFTMREVRTLLARFLFLGEDGFKDVSVLSGGEAVRIRLLLLMLEKSDFLVLDEPTNHLDIDTKSIIEDVFCEYPGPMMFVSHDRYFINKVATKILAFDNGDWRLIEGNYEDYKAAITQTAPSPKPRVDRPQRIDVQKEVAKRTEMVQAYESELHHLQKALFEPEVYSDHVRYHDTEVKIKEIESKIMSLLEEIETIHT
ncbi:MAG: ABC-F family ATP-binding cassette domain-containing protein [Candidatus Izemoplasmatales bacterium]|jgi:ATP-binding cassette subfamily F protein 3